MKKTFLKIIKKTWSINLKQIIIYFLFKKEETMMIRHPLSYEKTSKRKTKEIMIKETTDFRPGNTSYYEYHGEVLNGEIEWNEIILDLMARGYDEKSIATHAKCVPMTVYKVRQKNFDDLTFQQGARILAIHSRFHPVFY